MVELGRHLVSSVPPLLSEGDVDVWERIFPLIETEGLESALLKIAPTASLEAAIVQSTGNFISEAESAIIAQVFNNTKTLRLTKLLPHLIHPDTGVSIVTTNYDRLIEIAAEEAELGVDTMFCGHFAAKLSPLESLWSFCRSVKLTGRIVRYKWAKKVNVFKPHGSLDWYQRGHSSVRFAGSLPLPRLIITPGINKFRSGYESPFDKHREKGNDAIDKARLILVIGYGFNDDHLETHLTPRIRTGVKTLMLALSLSQKARNLALENKNVIAIESAERSGIKGSCVIADGVEHFFPGVDYWDVEGFVNGVLIA